MAPVKGVTKLGIIARVTVTRVLGLPGDIRPDKDIPFSEATRLG
jgi:hypothetical protein